MQETNLFIEGIKNDGDIHIDGKSSLIQHIHGLFAFLFLDIVPYHVIPGGNDMEAGDINVLFIKSPSKFLEDYTPFAGL
jgi:hypothetical protein